MTPIFENRFFVRSNELGDDNSVNHTSIVQWFQETAFQASEANGFGSDYYTRAGSTWLVHELDVEFFTAARYRDEIAVKTWVSDMRRVRSHREYQARRVQDGELIASGRVDWVYLDSEKLTLKRIDAGMQARFAPNDTPALSPIEWPDSCGNGDGSKYESSRRVQLYEHDGMHHVNNTIYLAWIEQQMADAWRDWGYDLGRLDIRRHKIEYLQQSKYGDSLQVSSRAIRCDGRYFWSHHIARGETIILRGHSLSTGGV